MKKALSYRVHFFSLYRFRNQTFILPWEPNKYFPQCNLAKAEKHANKLILHTCNLHIWLLHFKAIFHAETRLGEIQSTKVMLGDRRTWLRKESIAHMKEYQELSLAPLIEPYSKTFQIIKNSRFCSRN